MKPVIDRRAVLATSVAGLASGIAGRSAAQDAPVAPTTPMPALEVYAAPFIDKIALSPDGKRVAAVTQKGDSKILVTFNIGDNKPTSLSLGKVKVRKLFWGDNEHVILVKSVTMSIMEFEAQRGEFWMAHSINITTQKLTTFFQNQKDFASTTGSIVGQTGRYYTIIMGELKRVKINGQYRVTAANYRMAEDYALCLFAFDLEQDSGKLIYKGANGTEDFVVTPEGEVAAFSIFDERNKEWSLDYHIKNKDGSGAFKLIYRTKGEAVHRPSLIGLGRQGESVVVAFPEGDQHETVYREVSADGVVSAPLDPNGVVNRSYPLFHPVTFRLAGFEYQGDTIVHDFFDPLMKKLSEALPKMMGEGYRSYAFNFAEDPRQMLVYSEGGDDAGGYFFIDFSTGNSVQIASNYPDLPSEWVTQKQAIDYKVADGLNIHAYLTLPPFKVHKNLPLIVLPHGGPQSRDDIDFDWQAQTLASRGYAVLQPNFRGSDGYGAAFVNAGHGEWGRKMQTDLSDGVRFLVGKGLIDPKRVAILGASYGGYAALAGATLDPGVYNCAVSIAGPSDLKAFVEWKDNNTGNRESTSVLYWKEFMGDQNRLDEISPAKQAAKAYCPILMIHGTDDTVVPIDQSRRMESALKAAGKPVELITYPGQDHWETVGSARIDMMTRAVEFLARHNPA